jgi:putative transposase
MDETIVLFGGHWKQLYRAVDRAGDTVEFLLTAKRDVAASRRFLEQVCGS